MLSIAQRHQFSIDSVSSHYQWSRYHHQTAWQGMPEADITTHRWWIQPANSWRPTPSASESASGGSIPRRSASIILWPAPLSFDWSPHLRLTCGPAGNRTTTGSLSASTTPQGRLPRRSASKIQNPPQGNRLGKNRSYYCGGPLLGVRKANVLRLRKWDCCSELFYQNSQLQQAALKSKQMTFCITAAVQHIPAPTLPDKPLHTRVRDIGSSQGLTTNWHPSSKPNGNALCVKTRQWQSSQKCKPADQP